MRIWRINHAQSALELSERPVPEVGPGELLVAVKAASLNHHDLLTLQSADGHPQRTDLIPVSDGAGEIVAMGENVTGFSKGDRVCGAFYPHWIKGDSADADLRVRGSDVDGMLAEYVVMEPDSAVKLPDYLDFAEGACLPCAAVTAWNGLVEYGNLQENQTVLSLGTGGVSLFALQIARALGCRVIITSSSDDKLARARKLGAAHGINYRSNPEWDREVLSLTGERGVDMVAETGGSGTFKRSVAAVRTGGTIALIGMVDQTPSTVSPFELFFKNLHVHGVRVGNRESFESMLTFFERHRIHPVIDRVFNFDEAKVAYEYLHGGSHFGKIVIEF
jgi:NADPH:quinone reductase-like Zn-dependent oxidoreductase